MSVVMKSALPESELMAVTVTTARPLSMIWLMLLKLRVPELPSAFLKLMVPELPLRLSVASS